MRNYNGYGYRSSGNILVPAAATAVTLGMFGLLGYAAYESVQTRSVDGIVMEGENGKSYVVPNNPTQPVYANQQDCIRDVKAHMAQIQKATGGTVDPNKVCQPASQYPVIRAYPLYRNGEYVGPVIGKKYEWKSTDTIWMNTAKGTFAATSEDESSFPEDMAPAPKGVTEGEHVTTDVPAGGEHGGFGGEGGHVGFSGAHGGE